MKTVPHSLDAERAILGAVLRAPDRLGAILDLRPKDFWGPTHERIWNRMLELHRDGKPIDPVALSDHGIELEVSLELAGHVATAENLPYYVRQVQEHAARRRMLSLAEELGMAARSNELPVDQIISDNISALQECYRGHSEFRHIREYAEAWLGRVNRRKDRGDIPPPGVATGVGELNQTLTFGGLARGHLTVVGAESSEGKSALLDNAFCLTAARSGQRVCLCSFEDEGSSVAVRMISSMARTGNRQLQQEHLSLMDWSPVMEAYRELVGLDIWVLDVVPANVDEMVGQIRRHLANHPADVLGIDYLQFVRAGGRHENRTAASEYVNMAIGVLARSLKNTATVVLTQYRKLREAKQRPTDDDLKDSGSLRHFAHAIIHIWSGPTKAQGLGCKMLLLTKNKNGPVGDVVAGWQPRWVTFCDPTERDKATYLTAMGGAQ